MKAPDIEGRGGKHLAILYLTGQELIWTDNFSCLSFEVAASLAFLVREGPFRWNVLSSFHAHWLPALSLFHIRRSTRKPYSVFLGVTPGLKAFPSSLIDNNALARTFLPGRADTTPPPPWISVSRHSRKTESWRGCCAPECRWPGYAFCALLTVLTDGVAAMTDSSRGSVSIPYHSVWQSTSALHLIRL